MIYLILITIGNNTHKIYKDGAIVLKHPQILQINKNSSHYGKV